MADIDRWLTYFDEQDYDIEIIVMVRDPWVQRRSRAKAANRSINEGMERYDLDYRAAFKAILSGDYTFCLVSYECLLWKGAAARILSLWGFTQEFPLIVQGKITEIRDENGKWYARP